MKTRDKIIQTSLDLFNEYGERNITTNHIAAHLKISPGNLYYHFRNKEDIISCIFEQYQQTLITRFQPYNDNHFTLDLLMGYFDAVFYTLWQYRFMYANLADILSRNEELQNHYAQTQQQLLDRSCNILKQLCDDGVMDIPAEQIIEVADTIKMLSSFWISYQLTQSSMSTITKAQLYTGLLRILMFVRSYATHDAKLGFDRLEHHYRQLATQPS